MFDSYYVVMSESTDEIIGLDSIMELGGTAGREYSVLNGLNMGNNTLLLSLPYDEFHQKSEVANQQNINEIAALAEEKVAQRKLDPAHAKSLAGYILKGLCATILRKCEKQGKEPSSAFYRIYEALGRQPYLSLQPVTANLRNCKSGGADLKFKRYDDGKVTVFLSDAHKLFVIDGQHRREGMNIALQYLRDVVSNHSYPKRIQLFTGALKGEELNPDELEVWQEMNDSAKTICTVMIELHLGLGSDEERQLFHDLNNLGKRIPAGMAFSYDNSNPINLYIKECLLEEHVLSAKIEEKDIVNWDEDTGVMARKDVVAVNAMLFQNKTNIKGAQPEVVSQRKEYANQFWKLIDEMPGFGEPGAKNRTVLAQPVVLKAIAKLFFNFKWGKEKNAEAFIKLVGGLHDFDFGHLNPAWRYYIYEELQREDECPGLSEYLPSADVEGNRDIGGFDAQKEVFRFGAKHNDIFPLIGDMIRWKLGLPNRRKI